MAKMRTPGDRRLVHLWRQLRPAGAAGPHRHSIDYYRIVINREIGTVPATVILAQCLQTGDPTYCKLIVRDAGGSIIGSSVQTGGYIVQTEVNIGAASVKGIDLQANYKWNMERLGSVLFSLNGAALLADTSTPQPGAHTFDCVGLYGPTCATLNPRWRHNLRASWNSPWDVGVSVALLALHRQREPR